LLELDLGLQGFLSTVLELIVPGLGAPALTGPGMVAPRLAVPGVVAPRLAVPGLVAPVWVIPGLVAPYWKVSGSVPQVSLVVGIEAWVFCGCCGVLSHTLSLLWPMVFLPTLTFYSLVLEPGLRPAYS